MRSSAPTRKMLVARWRAADGYASGPIVAATGRPTLAHWWSASDSANIAETNTPAVPQWAASGKR